MVAKAALVTAPPSVTYTEPLAEVSRFDRDSGTALIVTDLSYAPGKPARLTVETDRDVKEVTASLAGPLTWRREGDKIEIDCPVPEAFDVVILH